MITGWLPLPPGLAQPTHPRLARPATAFGCLAACTTVAALVLGALSRLPPLGVPAMPVDRAWAGECGSCHQPFHPSLLPRASWRAVMAGLDDHFGEDASLPAATSAQIGTFLDRYAAEAWDTEAARRFAVTAQADPLRITATPFWVAKHAAIDSALFAARAVLSRSNCAACHLDAASGRFDDQAIRLPQPMPPGASP